MKKKQVFLFQGDSITDGGRHYDGDPNHILGHGFVYQVSSFLRATCPESVPCFYNRGVSGHTSSQLVERWQKDALDIDPDVLTLLIGINDLLALYLEDGSENLDYHPALEKYQQNLEYMLQSSLNRNPDLKILLGIPFYYAIDGWDTSIHVSQDEAEKEFTLNFRKTVAQRRRTQILKAIPEFAAAAREFVRKYNAVELDFSAVFDAALTKAPLEYWIWDGVHPTYAGNYLMSQLWLEKAAPFL